MTEMADFAKFMMKSMPYAHEPAFTPGFQVDKLVGMAMSLGSINREALTDPYRSLFVEYLLRKPIEYFENGIVKVRIYILSIRKCQTLKSLNIWPSSSWIAVRNQMILKQRR